ncbi:hypothetical protein ACWDE9_08135, partial [Streptomyces olivaceoviridis]
MASANHPGFSGCSTSSATSAASEQSCRVGAGSRWWARTRATRRSRMWCSVRGGGVVTVSRGGSAGRPSTTSGPAAVVLARSRSSPAP